MKTLKILAFTLLASSAVMAQDLKSADVPSNLKQALEKEYTNATDVEWEKKLDNYKVEFEINRQDYEIWYDVSGKVLKKEQEIRENELPKAIQDAIKANYPDYRVDDVEKIWQNDTFTYDVELEKGHDEKHITFDGQAKVLNESVH